MGESAPGRQRETNPGTFRYLFHFCIVYDSRADAGLRSALPTASEGKSSGHMTRGPASSTETIRTFSSWDYAISEKVSEYWQKALGSSRQTVIRVSAITLAVIGMLLLLDNLDVIDFTDSFGFLWPLILVIIGFKMIRNRKGQQHTAKE